MARTLPSDGLAPIDAYTEVDTTNRGNAWFERYHNVAGGSYANNVCIRQNADTTVTYPTNLYVRSAIGASASIGSMYGIWINTTTPDAAATVGNLYDVSITHSGSAVPSYEALFRLYNSATSAAVAIDSVFHLANSGGTPFTNLFDFEAVVVPVSAGSDSTNCTNKVACLVGSDTRYIHLFSD